jgi:hypothetical protein
VDDFIDLKEVDPITNSSFEMMIKVAFRSDKNFVLAKVKTRSLQSQKEQALSQEGHSALVGCNSVTHSHFFNLHAIVKLLFKKKGDEIVGRFHSKHPITSKNPLTN